MVKELSDHERECLLKQGHNVVCFVRSKKPARAVCETAATLFPRARHVSAGKVCYDSGRWTDTEISLLAAPTEEMACAILDRLGLSYDLVVLRKFRQRSPA